MSEPADFYDKLLDVAREAERYGYAIVIWTPEELGETDPGRVEDIMIERGSEYIEMVNG